MPRHLSAFVLVLGFSIMLTACGKYGSGQTIGYVYAVDDGVLWDLVWYKSSLDSSESDCYIVMDDALKQRLRELSGSQKLKLHYDRYLMTVSEKSCSDEITAIEVVE